MARKEDLNQDDTEEGEKTRKEFVDLMQDIKDDTYQAESLLRGIQALTEGMMYHFEKGPWEPFHIAFISASLEKIVRTIGDKAEEVDTFFQANLKARPAPVMRAPEGRT